MKMNRVNAYKWTTMKCIQRIQITNDYIDTNIYIAVFSTLHRISMLKKMDKPVLFSLSYKKYIECI